MTVLGMFFTRGVSLRNWVESGLFDREVQIYHSHIESGYFSRIYWFTYGADDAGIADELRGLGRLSEKIEIIPCPRWVRFAGRGASILYSFILPMVLRKIASRCDVFKTNQMEGSIPALICASIWQRPLYIRTGYTLSRVIKKISPGNWVRCMVAMVNEYLSFRFASASSVSSRFDRDYIIQRYGARVTPPMIIGNYVDTLLFSPYANELKVNDRVLYVGRLSPEKNLDNAIAACATIGLGLDMIGAGAELPRLKEIAVECGANVRWLGVVPNNQLPDLFRHYRYFILPSYWEGLPKALIEAMSAGLICIGNDTTGINEIIEEGVTGYLSPSPDAIVLAETLRRALAGHYVQISRAGREFACKNFSLDAITAKEQAIFTHILTKK